MLIMMKEKNEEMEGEENKTTTITKLENDKSNFQLVLKSLLIKKITSACKTNPSDYPCASLYTSTGV